MEQRKQEEYAEENWMQITFAAKSENEGFARTAVAAFVSSLDPTIEELADIKTAVSEAVTNCIIHGYNQRGGTIWMEGTLTGRKLRVSIIDEGRGIKRYQAGVGTAFYHATGSRAFRHGIFLHGSLYGYRGSGIHTGQRNPGFYGKRNQVVTYGAGVGVY